MNQDVFSYVISEENSWKTTEIPLTNSKNWNMFDHIQRCYNVANGWFHSGKNDGNRPYNDVVTPIIDVAFRTEGFDVKDIVPYVDDIKESYKSFIIKKDHPGWAKKNLLDTLIDDVVESSIIYDLVIVKDSQELPIEVIDLRTVAFCDQTDASKGPLCIKHDFTVVELKDMEGKWDADAIKTCIQEARNAKDAPLANGAQVKTGSKSIEVYELHGSFPESWYKEDGDPEKYVEQLHIISYYTASDGNKRGIHLYKGKTKPFNEKFFFLKIDSVRSKGRACGRSIVERLFEPQVWANYSEIKMKKMLDAAVNLLQTDSEEYGGKSIASLKENTVLKHEPGRPITKVDMNLQNFATIQDYKERKMNEARTLGSASEASLGKNPVSGTPFALQDLVVQQGEGIHEYRRGKIATFFADVLYPKSILKHMIQEINNGKAFSEELSLDELIEISDAISTKEVNKVIKEKMLKSKKKVTRQEQELITKAFKEGFTKGNKRRFLETLKGELSDVPIKVKVNVAGKQKYMAQQADKLSKLISNVLANPQAFAQIPGLAKTYNELLENSGLSPIDFSGIIQGTQLNPEIQTKRIESPISKQELQTEQPKA